MDCQFNVGNLPLGTNLFVYCNNSPVGGTDPKGTDTYAVGGTVNANAYYGATFSLAFVFDSYGGFDIQYSYAFAGIDHSHSFGVLDVGMGGFFQYTQLDQVNDLLGVSASVGASGGTGISFGIDAVSSGYVAENVLINGKESPDGVQFTAGVGLGVDVHIVNLILCLYLVK